MNMTFVKLRIFLLELIILRYTVGQRVQIVDRMKITHVQTIKNFTFANIIKNFRRSGSVGDIATPMCQGSGHSIDSITAVQESICKDPEHRFVAEVSN